MLRNRITQSNGRTRLPEPQEVEKEASGRTITDDLRVFLQKNPGKLLIMGFVVGGVMGWLTSRTRR